MLRSWSRIAFASLWLAGYVTQPAATRIPSGPSGHMAPGPATAAPSTSQTTLCTGTPTADVPVNVTSQMSHVAPNVTVWQLTGLDAKGKVIIDEGGQPATNFLANADHVNYSAALNPPSFIIDSGSTRVKTIRADHKGAQVAGTKTGLNAHVSLDGTLAVQAGLHAPDHSGEGADLLVTNLASGGSCTSKWITNQHFIPARGPGASGIPVTNPSWDAEHGKYLIAYAPGSGDTALGLKVYSVYSDGSPSPYAPVEPADSCKGVPGLLYHGIRVNWRFPYLVVVDRENGIGKNECADMLDLRTGATVEFGDDGPKNPGQTYFNHNDLNPDGRTWLVTASRSTGGMSRAVFLDADGKFIKGSNYPQSSENPAGYVILNLKSGVQAEWCSWGTSNTALCTSRLGTGNPRGAQVFPGQTLSEACYPAYAIDLSSFALRFLTCTDGWKTRKYEGFAVIRYAYTDAEGMAHALFRSDKSGTPQVYEVVYKP